MEKKAFATCYVITSEKIEKRYLFEISESTFRHESIVKTIDWYFQLSLCPKTNLGSGRSQSLTPVLGFHHCCSRICSELSKRSLGLSEHWPTGNLAHQVNWNSIENGSRCFQFNCRAKNSTTDIPKPNYGQNWANIRPLEERIRARGFKIGPAQTNFSNDILNLALQFSFQSKLAPLWNTVRLEVISVIKHFNLLFQVGPYMLQGRLAIRESVVEAVKPRLSLSAFDETLMITLSAGQLRSSLLALEDFQIDSMVLHRFKKGQSQVIPGQYIGLPKVRVIPNLTSATVFSISKKMLTSPGLETWKDMKRYWKNMWVTFWTQAMKVSVINFRYGIRLTDVDNEEPDFFCNVFFPVDPTVIFSYPQWCIRELEPLEVPRKNSAPVVAKFQSDLKSKACFSLKVFALVQHSRLQ